MLDPNESTGRSALRIKWDQKIIALIKKNEPPVENLYLSLN